MGIIVSLNALKVTSSKILNSFLQHALCLLSKQEPLEDLILISTLP